MKPKILVVFLALSLMITFASILLEVPTSTPYSVFNTGGNGYSLLLDKYSLTPLINISSIKLSEAQDTVVLIPLLHGLDNYTSNYLLKFLEMGGRIIVLDKHGYINGFLQEVLGLGIRVENAAVYDDIFNYRGDRSLPSIKVFINNANLTCYLHEPAVISIRTNNSDVRIIGFSSRYSLRDNDANGYFNVGDSIGSEPIAIIINHGKGTLVIVSDLDFLTNKYIVLGDNDKFFKSLINGKKHRHVLLGGLDISFHDYLKVYVYGFQSRREYWIRILSEFIVLFIILVLFYYGERSGFTK